MKTRILMTILTSFTTLFAQNNILEKAMFEAMKNQKGTCIFIDCKSDRIYITDTTMATIRLSPCSTFKIWNTLIGAECHIISNANELFYKWDGETRFLPAWNKDQNLKDAFQASCVPAFQILARKIGVENMKKWIDSISYGDRNISSGIDNFWLPIEGKKSIQISPIEQAQLIKKLIKEELPFSANSCNLLKEIMLIETTSNGKFFGKTGTGPDLTGNPALNTGWFVGYVISKAGTYSFVCLLKGQYLAGKDSRNIIEAILKKTKLI